MATKSLNQLKETSINKSIKATNYKEMNLLTWTPSTALQTKRIYQRTGIMREWFLYKQVCQL